MSTTANRKAVLDAAGILLQLNQECVTPSWGTKYEDSLEASLVDSVQRAVKALEEWRRSKAARLALDALVPGWKLIDVSDLLPRDKWFSFTSNEPTEWVEWLISNGVFKETAIKRVKEAFEAE